MEINAKRVNEFGRRNMEKSTIGPFHPKKIEDFKHDPVFVEFFKNMGIDILSIKTGYEEDYGEHASEQN
jgi:hypothetical protein